MIMEGYNDSTITVNKNNSLIGYMKIDHSEKYHKYLYLNYFSKTIDGINKKLEKAGLTKIDITFKKEKVALKKADIIRIENTDKLLVANEDKIYEFVLLHCCKKFMKHNRIIYYYTIIQLLKNSIKHINKYVIQFIETFLAMFEVNKGELIENASEYIEENEGLQKYNDMSLYQHQKELFTICRENRDKPKLLFYQAPTGTGKTMSPLALTKDYCVLFVCAAKHIGLQLARACISMEIPIGVAFGCEDATGVRLHYFAAKDYVKNKFTGGIFKVDHSVGDKAKLIVCDIKSYLSAMYYMLSFHKPEDIILYWDEPTISLDYESHEIHGIIQNNWAKNTIPNIILSSATLPSIDLIPNCKMSFKFNHPTGIIENINSFDCKKTISIISPKGDIVMPHTHYSESSKLKKSLEHIQSFRTVMRHLNVTEITKFLIKSQNYISDELRIDNYFKRIEDITITNIKLYYLSCMEQLSDKWEKYYDLFKKEQAYESTIYLTTSDAITITGPTIFLTNNIEKVSKFYLQQSKNTRG